VKTVFPVPAAAPLAQAQAGPVREVSGAVAIGRPAVSMSGFRAFARRAAPDRLGGSAAASACGRRSRSGFGPNVVCEKKKNVSTEPLTLEAGSKQLLILGHRTPNNRERGLSFIRGQRTGMPRTVCRGRLVADRRRSRPSDISRPKRKKKGIDSNNLLGVGPTCRSAVRV